MQSVLRSIRAQPPLAVFSSPLPYNFGRKSSGVRFQQAAAGTDRPENRGGSSMDQSSEKPKPNVSGDTMSSFGEGYATRSDEEGFGGIYGGNQDVAKEDEKKKDIHEHSHEFDKNQGSEVKETEKSRHQKDTNS